MMWAAALPAAENKPERDKPNVPAVSNHWAFLPVSHPALPKVAKADARWIRSPVDNFVLAVLQKRKITPAAEADRATLIRRLSFDLIGLPPSPEEVGAFLEDKRPDAYE